MNISFRILFITVTLIFSWSDQCHGLLNDFLKFNYEHSKIHLTKTCVDDLNSIKSGIENNNAWALKGKLIECRLKIKS